MEIIKSSKKYIFIFTTTFLILLIFGFYNNKYDMMWNYSFSYSIAKGEIPYKDFNMISTPLFSMIGALFLIVSKNYVFFLIYQSIIITLMFYPLFKLYHKNAWVIFFFLLFPFLHTIIPTYNFFVFFLLIILIYLEKENKNDFLVGLIIGFSILTKHTIGLFYILPSLLYIRQPKKILKRMIGIIIPCFLFLIYLLITKSLSSFINLCVLGLFDFQNNANVYFNLYMPISLIILLIMLYKTRKDKNNIINYYLLTSFSFIIPLFDSYHFSFLVLSFLLMFLYGKQEYTYTSALSIILSIFIIGINFYIHDGIHCKRLNLKNLEFYYTDKENYQIIHKMNQIYKKYENSIYLSIKSPYISVINNQNTNYFLVYLKGNFGYNGDKELIKKIDALDNYFILNKEEIKQNEVEGDYFVSISRYIIDHYKLVSKEGEYLVYQKEA